MEICDECNKIIPINEWINVFINPITNEKKNYCEKCRIEKSRFKIPKHETD